MRVLACRQWRFWPYRAKILSFFTGDAEVLRLGVRLLAIAALFQLFDGIQTVATGALRGLGEHASRRCLLTFADIGFLDCRSDTWLCFQRGFGIAGLWWGLTRALVVISLVLLPAWQRQTKAMLLEKEARTKLHCWVAVDLNSGVIFGKSGFRQLASPVRPSPEDGGRRTEQT